jgi:hypothetical protein
MTNVVTLVVVALVACEATRADDLVAVDSHTLNYEKPHAPKIICNISMQYWCIVQADSLVNMVDNEGYRTWSVVAAGSKATSVIIRENKLCDSPAEYHPRRISEKDEITAPERLGHIVTFSLTKDDVCTLSVEYPLGDDDWARHGQQIAKYRLLICNGSSRRVPLLSIK